MKTIIAPSSAVARSGVIVVRLSGENAFEISEKICRAKLPEAGKFALRKLFDETGEVFDEALILRFDAPKSFTGENVVEFHIHGSRAILSKILRVAIETGLCRLAQAGEFTRRAFENNKMDLARAEGLADLIDAETEAQRKQALNQMRGALSDKAKEWREILVEILAFAEAYIDFPDEDLPSGLDEYGLLKIADLHLALNHLLTDYNKAQRIRDGYSVAIIGPPNAGKSSLLNAIARREAAIVSEIAGTTRDIVEISMILGGNLIFLADTAGLRESLDVIENLGINKAIERAESADLRLLVIENKEDFEKYSYLLQNSDFVVFSKADLNNNSVSIENFEAFYISAKSYEGIENLEKQIAKKFSSYDGASSLITRQRHYDAIKKAISHLQAVLEEPDLPTELACEEIRLAARALSSILGEIDVEEILDKVFSSFCIGK